MSDEPEPQPELTDPDAAEFAAFKAWKAAQADPEPKAPAAPATGGGQDVPANKMQEFATAVVKATTEAAILAGRKEGAGPAPAAAAAPAPPTKKRFSFFGEDE
jgi:hypothetical protein